MDLLLFGIVLHVQSSVGCLSNGRWNTTFDVGLCSCASSSSPSRESTRREPPSQEHSNRDSTNPCLNINRSKRLGTGSHRFISSSLQHSEDRDCRTCKKSKTSPVPQTLVVN